MEYTTIQSEPRDETSARIRVIFGDIEKKARLSGNTALLVELDRIPAALLGPSNRVPDGAMDAANGHAVAALERITEAFAADDASGAPAAH
jgi:hypothetical protein